MKKYIYHILFGILLLFLFLPMIQKKVKFDIKPLNGVTYKTEFPKFEMETFNSGKYQSQLEKYIAENFGFRGAAAQEGGTEQQCHKGAQCFVRHGGIILLQKMRKNRRKIRIGSIYYITIILSR